MDNYSVDIFTIPRFSHSVMRMLSHEEIDKIIERLTAENAELRPLRQRVAQLEEQVKRLEEHNRRLEEQVCELLAVFSFPVNPGKVIVFIHSACEGCVRCDTYPPCVHDM